MYGWTTTRLWKDSVAEEGVLSMGGEVQTREEARCMSSKWTFFVTVMFLEETPAVLSLGKLCEDHGYTYHWTSGQKPHLTNKGKIIDWNMSSCVLFVVPGLSASSSTTPTPTSSSSSSQDSVFDVSNEGFLPVGGGIRNVPIPHLHHMRAVRTCSFVSVSLHICLLCFQTGRAHKITRQMCDSTCWLKT